MVSVCVLIHCGIEFECEGSCICLTPDRTCRWRKKEFLAKFSSIGVKSVSIPYAEWVALFDGNLEFFPPN